ncbi:MAG: asparagine synthase (glutamine-hydrolyzing) [Ignavibacterium sp.]|nr:asparagine synthase (glutamine-hydrolyzing) [Ignavibacterium sp.]
MCGIAGIVNTSGKLSADIPDIRKMVHLLHHRGPDQTGIYIDDNAALAQSRLSIIDLRGGIQPIYNEDKSLWIIFNGEIFNYPDIREYLISKGHKFYTTTDTEVIIHLYEEDGINCVHKLNGQFAFAIWDSKKKSLFIARDRVGIRPLFYTLHNNQLIFSSEIKAILSLPGISCQIDYQALDQVFTFWTTLKGKTLFDGIFELSPGHFLFADSNGIKIDKFWHIPFSSAESENNREKLIENVSELLFDAVKIRLRADVPVGTYLSGGLDSSGITSTVKKNFNNKLRTFGIRFEAGDFDEGEYQQEMVNYLGVDHSELFINNSDIAQNLESLLWFTEKPLLRTAPIPLYLLSRLVHKSGYKVVLTGEGADEIFGGYNIFKETKIRNFWAKYPDSKMRPALLAKLYPYIFKDKRLNDSLTEFFRFGIDDPGNPFFSHIIRWNNTSKIKTFFSPKLKAELENHNSLDELLKDLPSDFYKWNYLSKAQYLEISVFLSNYLLSSQGDRAAMAHSVEMRMPFLDYRIIERMSNVDPELKINGLNEKFLLKKIFKDILPDKVLNRDKNPYRAPIKQGILFDKTLIEKYLSYDSLTEAGLFDFKKVSLLLNKMNKFEKAGEVDNMALIGILSAQIIQEKFIKSFSPDYTAMGNFDIVFDLRN